MKAKKKSVNYGDIPEIPSAKIAEATAFADEAAAFEVGAFAAKTHLSAILQKVAHGQTWFITKHGQRIAEIRPVADGSAKVKPGFAKGSVWMAKDFDDPLPEMLPYME